MDSGIVDVNQSGPSNTLDEFNRCFYERSVDTGVDTIKFPIMLNFDDEGVIETTLK